MPPPSSASDVSSVHPSTAAKCNLHPKKILLLLLIGCSCLRLLWNFKEGLVHAHPEAAAVSVVIGARATPSEVNKNKDKDMAPFTFVHIIKTRFMQFQPNLLHLGYARLALFKTFCLPSMLSQTNQNFLWVIRTDPNLNPELLQPLIELLEGRPNFILLGSTDNPTGFSRYKQQHESIHLQSPSSFGEYLFAHLQKKIGKSEGKHAVPSHGNKDAEALVFSGNITLLEQAFNSTTNGEGIVLETRLDADDGLHRDFVSTIQAEAMKYLPHSVQHGEESDSDSNDSNSTNLWRIWCVDADAEWHPISPQQGQDNDTVTQIQEQGYLVKHHNQGCVTPGLSVAFGAGYSSKSNFLGGHAHIHDKKKICTTSKQIGCYSRLKELAPVGAIRARTTTSAGMQKVGQVLKEKALDDDLWKVFDFVPLEAVKETREWIVEHQSAIAEDNLNGQCTPYFGCKNRTVGLLSMLANNTDGNSSKV